MIEGIGFDSINTCSFNRIGHGILIIEIDMGIVFVDQLRRFVGKKRVFNIPVVFKGLMVIKMVAGNIRMHLECKVDPLDPLLVDPVGTNLHDEILTSRLFGTVDVVQILEQ